MKIDFQQAVSGVQSDSEFRKSQVISVWMGLCGGESLLAGRISLLFENAKSRLLFGDFGQKSGGWAGNSSQFEQEILQAVFQQPCLFQCSLNVAGRGCFRFLISPRMLMPDQITQPQNSLSGIVQAHVRSDR